MNLKDIEKRVNELNISFMDDGLAIMEELLAPVVNGSRNNLNLTELTDSQVKALYGGLTYLQMLHENVDKGIKELYKAINAKNGGQ